jgi:hypothetical protein
MAKIFILKVLKIVQWQVGYLLIRHQLNQLGIQILMAPMVVLEDHGGWVTPILVQMGDALIIGIRC